MWFAPIIPVTRDDVFAFRGIIEPIFAKHGLEACITLTAVNERCFDCTLPILYDKDDPDEVANAQACLSGACRACREHGYIRVPAGPAVDGAGIGARRRLLGCREALKGALDPERILAPGRYGR